MVQIRSNSNWRLIFFILTFFFLRSLASFFHEKMLLQCHVSDNLFNCMVGHAKANKRGAVGVYRLPLVPRTTYGSAEGLGSFIISCYLSDFTLWKQHISKACFRGLLCFSVLGLNSFCSSHICNHSATVFIPRALCGPVLV